MKFPYYLLAVTSLLLFAHSGRGKVEQTQENPNGVKKAWFVEWQSCTYVMVTPTSISSAGHDITSLLQAKNESFQEAVLWAEKSKRTLEEMPESERSVRLLIRYNSGSELVVYKDGLLTYGGRAYRCTAKQLIDLRVKLYNCIPYGIELSTIFEQLGVK
jgi:hypothetical protein